VNCEKPNYTYIYNNFIDDLPNKSAEEVAIAIRGRPDNLGCKTGFELLF
jgi:hypothetical protein